MDTGSEGRVRPEAMPGRLIVCGRCGVALVRGPVRGDPEAVESVREGCERLHRRREARCHSAVAKVVPW